MTNSAFGDANDETMASEEAWKTELIERVPYHPKKNWDKDMVEKRRNWHFEDRGISSKQISNYNFDPADVKGNTENFIGVAQVPIGLVGPVRVNGDHASGTFYVPFATTEGALIETYTRGAIAIAKAGGAQTLILEDENHLEPVFVFRCMDEVKAFLTWLDSNFKKIKSVADSTTKHGKLTKIKPHVFGIRVVLDIAYDTADAMGANLVNVATEKVCDFISKEQPIKYYMLRSNFTSEKKGSAYHLLSSYGKQVTAEVVLPAGVVGRYLQSTPKKISAAWRGWATASLGSGTIGMNAHFANGLAAMFIACGQDPAHVGNGCIGLIMFEETDAGDLYAAVKMSSLLVGTVGGGTALSTQRECLESLGCYGVGKAKKFAEIVAASILAGEIGICAGITSPDFQAPHKRARVHTVEKAYETKK